MNGSKTVGGILLVLLWFWTIDKTIKTLSFHNNAYLLHQLSIDPEAYSEPYQKSKREWFSKIINDF